MFYLCIAFFGTIGCMSYANTSIGRIMDVLKMSVPTLKVGNNDDQNIASDSYSSSSKLVVLKDLGNTDINRTSDFELIGGRDYWINYINEVPGKYHFMKYYIHVSKLSLFYSLAYWTVYGFAVTIQWITGFVSGAVITIAVTIVPIYISSG